MQEVSGSIPLTSTTNANGFTPVEYWAQGGDEPVARHGFVSDNCFSDASPLRLEA